MSKEEILRKIEELERQVNGTMAEISDPKECLEKDYEEVPETLDSKYGEKFWLVNGSGNVCCALRYGCNDEIYINRRAFKTEEIAKLFQKKHSLSPICYISNSCMMWAMNRILMVAGASIPLYLIIMIVNLKLVIVHGSKTERSISAQKRLLKSVRIG